MDVIEKLFNMSDDLRVERESIIEKGVHIDPFHTLTTGNMTENDVRQQGAATLRYSEEIEEVARVIIFINFFLFPVLFYFFVFIYISL